MENTCKCIFSIGLARTLIAKKVELVDVEPSRRYPGKLVFIFRDGPELTTVIKEYSKAN